MTYAVHTARRGGAPAAAVVNTLPVEELLRGRQVSRPRTGGTGTAIDQKERAR
jgi:hypothetical protein